MLLQPKEGAIIKVIGGNTLATMEWQRKGWTVQDGEDHEWIGKGFINKKKGIFQGVFNS